MRVCTDIGQVGELVPGIYMFFGLCMCRLSVEMIMVDDEDDPD